MFKFNNTHIFTGYLKQLLSNINIPACRIYTKEYSNYLSKHGKEDPRVIESFDSVNKNRAASRTCYLKDGGLYNYFCSFSNDGQTLTKSGRLWQKAYNAPYESTKKIPGLTRQLDSPGIMYDVTTHEYLGDYLRFLRDYHGVDLMSLYNCFNNKIYNNIYYRFNVPALNLSFNDQIEESPSNQKFVDSYRVFDSQDSSYRIYAFPVKLFSVYTIAIDCPSSIEMFCGLYGTALNTSDKAVDLISRTYTKKNGTMFRQPFLFDKLSDQNWNFEKDTKNSVLIDGKTMTRYDLANYEQDLKLFLKVPASCNSSIVVLEGDYRHCNDCLYIPKANSNFMEYKQNHSIVNFGDKNDNIDLNQDAFKPIGKLQLLALNTGESYPFADRLIEYLSNSTITPLDEIPDNIKRAQSVMRQNGHRFKIEGLWEDKMQKICYDYIMNSGPVTTVTVGNQASDKDYYNKPVDATYKGKTKCKLVTETEGYHRTIGHNMKSSLYDVLGYIDKDVEKWYASWTVTDNDEVAVRNSIANVDIYNGLFDI